MRKYWYGEKKKMSILTGLYVSSTPENENVIHVRKYCDGENPEHEKGAFTMPSVCLSAILRIMFIFLV
jgi:hypothetical protein